MASYPPPLENLSVFNRASFVNAGGWSNTTTFLKYPLAQGQETFPSIQFEADGTVQTTAYIPYTMPMPKVYAFNLYLPPWSRAEDSTAPTTQGGAGDAYWYFELPLQLNAFNLTSTGYTITLLPLDFNYHIQDGNNQFQYGSFASINNLTLTSCVIRGWWAAHWSNRENSSAPFTQLKAILVGY